MSFDFEEDDAGGDVGEADARVVWGDGDDVGELGREELDGGDFGALLVVAGVVGGVDGLHVVEFFGGVDEALAVDESGDEFGREGGEGESCDVVTSVDPREYFALG